MKRIFTILSSCVFLTFVACGGGDDGGGAPPPPLSSPLNPGSVEIKDDMLNQINALKGGACDQEGTQVMLFLIASQQGQGQGGGMGGGMPMPMPQSSASGGCDNLLNNILWNASHIIYTNQQPWINDTAAKMWLAQRIGALLNRVQRNVAPAAQAAGIPPDQLLNTFQGQLMPYFQQKVQRLNATNPGLGNAASSYIGGSGF